MASKLCVQKRISHLQVANREAKQLTKEALQEALLILLEDKPLERISISELSQKAGVSRNAFYRHYTSIKALFHKMIKMATLRVVKGLQRFNLPSERYQAWLYLFQKAKEHARLLKAILKHNMLHWIDEIIISRLTKWQKNKHDHQNNYVHSFWSQAILSVLGRWINDGMVVPEEEMAAMNLPLIFES